MASKPTKDKFMKMIVSSKFANFYAIAALLILISTTVVWSLLSARIQMSNADQLVNPYLFQHYSTFQNALLPAQHSFLFKWPIFYLVKVFGSTYNSYLVATVSVVLTTVLLFVLFIYKIEKRPEYFGTICLALASVLLLVPTQPYAGAILPVNMAMISTRNLEYILYIFALFMMVRKTKMRSWSFAISIISFAILIASDKLFLTLSLGAALILLIVYAVVGRWNLVKLAIKWLIASVLGIVLASLALWLITILNITHFADQSGVGPYGLAHNAHKLTLGIIYSVISIFTNFGANPAHNATTLRDIPNQLYNQLKSVGGIAYIINGILLGVAIVYGFIFTRDTFKAPKSNAKHTDEFYLSLTLIFSSITAILVYCLSGHDYLVDARYLTIVLFALFVVAATHITKKKWAPEKIFLAGLIISISIVLGIFAANEAYSADKAALQPTNDRNLNITQVLLAHPVDVLVGDYWRVIPTKFAAGNNIQVMPLSSCTQPRQALSSKNWQPDLNNRSFAYLLTLDKNLTNFPNCSFSQVVSYYGRPNTSTVIAGTVSNPKEILLFYDGGIHKIPAESNNQAQTPATIIPETIDQLTNSICSVPTIMDIVAHQDDDLLFMNPDLINNIKAGYCIRTVYITAGDAGNGEYYWIKRQQGSEAAYSYMLGVKDLWIERTIEIASNEYVTVANPSANPKIALIFMHLPDGNINGSGFKSTGYESLASLISGKIQYMKSVDGESKYTLSQLTNALVTLMHAYLPAEIRTQSTFIGTTYHDHSDHNSVGAITTRAHSIFDLQQYAGLTTTSIKYYEGYPIHEQPQNIFGSDLAIKTQTFLTYAKYDNSVCQKSTDPCTFSPAYSAYLGREYQNSF